ncbi:hypothetical protein [Croceivirga sp. JEA036]|uniref:hypothetical protein n=1 Tax=Croceivirga sp. JEA036 TaxID=2721162 RepID=UPI00143C40D9|nr:hypothetical protein [Croceivirga sp. JEA036]NJB35312.1 hypothetical protein [Croceivirga sp. JEA036]
MKKITFGSGITDEVKLPKLYNIEQIGKKVNENRETMWGFLTHFGIINVNGYANSSWLKGGFCKSYKNSNGSYKTYFYEKGVERILERWRANAGQNYLH